MEKKRTYIKGFLGNTRELSSYKVFFGRSALDFWKQESSLQVFVQSKNKTKNPPFDQKQAF